MAMRSWTEKDEVVGADRVTCPRCGWEDMDSWEINPDEGPDERECPTCGAHFEYEAFRYVEYTTVLIDGVLVEPEPGEPGYEEYFGTVEDEDA